MHRAEWLLRTKLMLSAFAYSDALRRLCLRDMTDILYRFVSPGRSQHTGACASAGE